MTLVTSAHVLGHLTPYLGDFSTELVPHVARHRRNILAPDAAMGFHWSFETLGYTVLRANDCRPFHSSEMPRSSADCIYCVGAMEASRTGLSSLGRAVIVSFRMGLMPAACDCRRRGTSVQALAAREAGLPPWGGIVATRIICVWISVASFGVYAYVLIELDSIFSPGDVIWETSLDWGFEPLP